MRSLPSAAVGTLVGYVCGNLAQNGWNIYNSWHRGAWQTIVPLVAYVLLVATTLPIAWRRGPRVGNGVLALGSICLLCCLVPFAVVVEREDVASGDRIGFMALMAAQIVITAWFIRRYLRGGNNALGYGILTTILTFVLGGAALSVIAVCRS